MLAQTISALPLAAASLRTLAPEWTGPRPQGVRRSSGVGGETKTTRVRKP